MDLKDAQLYDRIDSDPSHPLRLTLLHTAPTHRNLRNNPSTYYTSILDTIPAAPNGTNNCTHIFNILVTRSINGLDLNSVLGRMPPNVCD